MSSLDLRPSAWHAALLRGQTLAFRLALLGAVAVEQSAADLGLAELTREWIVPAAIVAAAVLAHAALLACAVGDMLLVALAVGVFALAEWGLGPSWRLLAGGFALFAATDTIRSGMIVHGDTNSSLALATLWPLAPSARLVAATRTPVAGER